jgi:hypothetical protein
MYSGDWNEYPPVGVCPESVKVMTNLIQAQLRFSLTGLSLQDVSLRCLDPCVHYHPR